MNDLISFIWILLKRHWLLKYLHRFDKNKKEGIGMDVCSLTSVLFFLSWYIPRHHPPERDLFSSIWLHSNLGLHCYYYSSDLPPDLPMSQLQLFSIPLVSPFRNYLYQEPRGVTGFLNHFNMNKWCGSLIIEKA